MEFIKSYNPLKTNEANLAAKHVQVFYSGTGIMQKLIDVNNNVI